MKNNNAIPRPEYSDPLYGVDTSRPPPWCGPRLRGRTEDFGKNSRSIQRVC